MEAPKRGTGAKKGVKSIIPPNPPLAPVLLLGAALSFSGGPDCLYSLPPP
jgi:hypothetical protein